MTLNYYIIDTSSLIKLNRDNPLDVFPSIWKNLSNLVKNDRLIAPKEVLNEIKQNDDQLCKWAKKQKNMFKEPTAQQIHYVKEILKKYPAIVDIDSKYSADPWSLH
jgi:rRNA maturation endonuclease Nob1